MDKGKKPVSAQRPPSAAKVAGTTPGCRDQPGAGRHQAQVEYGGDGGGAGHRGQNTTISRIQAWGVRLNLGHHGVCTQLKGGTVPGPILPSLLEVITPPRNGNSGFLPI